MLSIKYYWISTAHQPGYLAPALIQDTKGIGFWTAFALKGYSKLVPLSVRTITKNDGKITTL